jgi:hypothetical protein
VVIRLFLCVSSSLDCVKLTEKLREDRDVLLASLSELGIQINSVKRSCLQSSTPRRFVVPFGSWCRIVPSALRESRAALPERVRRAVIGLQDSAVLDGDLRAWLAALRSLTLHRLDDVQAVNNLAEHDVLAVQPIGLDGGDEEL